MFWCADAGWRDHVARIVEQIAEDGRDEARINVPEAKITAAFVALRPSGSSVVTTRAVAQAMTLCGAARAGRNEPILFPPWGFSFSAWSAGSLAQDLPGEPRLLLTMPFGADPRPLLG